MNFFEFNKQFPTKLDCIKYFEFVRYLVERNNKVKAIKVQHAQANTLPREIYSNVQTDSIIVTDEHKAYNSISISHLKYDHKVVNHSTGEYVRQDYITKRGEERKAFKIHSNTQ